MPEPQTMRRSDKGRVSAAVSAVIEPLEPRVLFAAPTDILTKAMRQELLNH
jgi:hypothetical protein